MALRLDFAATIRRVSVLGLASNMLVKRHSDFLTLGFLIGVNVIFTLGQLYVNHSGEDSIAESIIPFRFCWSSNLPAC